MAIKVLEKLVDSENVERLRGQLRGTPVEALALVLIGAFMLHWSTSGSIEHRLVLAVAQCFGLALVVLGGTIVLWVIFTRARKERPFTPPKVIGWAGIEDEALYKTVERRGTAVVEIEKPDCLVCYNSMDTLPQFKYRQRYFDIVICDVEFLGRYDLLGRLYDLRGIGSLDPEEDFFTDFPPYLYDAVKNVIYANQNGARRILGIPLQFGFMEYLVNKSNLPAGYSLETYEDFRVERLLDAGVKVGFWHWYLPSISHLVLPHVGGLDGGFDERMRRVARTGGKEVDAILRQIGEQPARCEVFSTAYDLSHALAREEVGVVFGAGSSLIHPQFDGSSIERIVPERQSPLWVNCAAALSPYAGPAPKLERLMRFWLDDGVQRALSQYSGYRGCPVRKDELLLIRNEENPSHPVGPTLDRVMDRQGKLYEEWQVGVRRLPREWCAWQASWEKLWRRVTRHEREGSLVA